MAYTITLTNGTVLTTIANDTIDTTTGLTLIGRNFAGYGGYIAENFVHLLESFANTTPPSGPLVGQLYYNVTLQVLQVWSGSAWLNAGFPGNGLLNQNITLQNGSLTLTNTANPTNQKVWRIRVSGTAPYIGMLVFEAMADDGVTVLNTVMALDGVNDVITGVATQAEYS